jgi:hypothetical protein
MSILRKNIFLTIFSACLFFLGTTDTYCQVYLQVERQNRVKTVKFQSGDQFEIRLHEAPREWVAVTIWSILPEENAIEFDIGMVSPDEIRSMRTLRQKNRGNTVFSYTLQFLAGTVLFSLADLAYGNSYNWGFVGGAGALAALGGTFKLVSDQFHYRFDRRHRLRIVDLRFSVD